MARRACSFRQPRRAFLATTSQVSTRHAAAARPVRPRRRPRPPSPATSGSATSCRGFPRRADVCGAVRAAPGSVLGLSPGSRIGWARRPCGSGPRRFSDMGHPGATGSPPAAGRRHPLTRTARTAPADARRVVLRPRPLAPEASPSILSEVGEAGSVHQNVCNCRWTSGCIETRIVFETGKFEQTVSCRPRITVFIHSAETCLTP